MRGEEINWIEGTPLGINVREIEFVAPHIHEDILEIIFCLKGSVKFSYEYEEFTLTAGDFISVDRDAHYLYDGKESICVSFYIHLNWFKEKYPFITSLLFVCEATKQSKNPFKTYYYDQLKGILTATLFYVGKHKSNEKNYNQIITSRAEKIIDLFIDHFDIIFYYTPDLKPKPKLMDRHHKMMLYLETYSAEKITLENIAKNSHLSEAYVSEFFRTYNIGFRKCLGYIRANNSEKFLLTTDMNIIDISEACGFSDPKYYYSAFKEWYKSTPHQFRKKYRKKMNRESKNRNIELSQAMKYLTKIMYDHYMRMFFYE